MGGGAAGYCYKRVAVVKADFKLVATTEQSQNHNYVYRGDCSVDISIHWKSESELSIKYKSNSRIGFSGWFSPKDKSGNVNVTYIHGT
ncbi:MAG: hypothetical protein MJK15_21710 [Colwellia sp.]|nr:hypothetical protein [Colwellia sp.]